MIGKRDSWSDFNFRKITTEIGRSRSEGKMDLGRPNSFPSKLMRAIEIKTGEVKNLSWGNSVRDKKGRV